MTGWLKRVFGRSRADTAQTRSTPLVLSAAPLSRRGEITAAQQRSVGKERRHREIILRADAASSVDIERLVREFREFDGRIAR